ncbi:MAG: hypothetical protein ACPGOV_15770 [Magnetovibrionaceae bacterium]
MLRVITSLNWVLGAFAIVLALIFPYINQAVVISYMKTEGEAVVEALADGQNATYEVNNKYIYFTSETNAVKSAMSNLNVDVSDSGYFKIAAYPTDEAALVIRAVTDPSALRDGWVPATAYEYVIKNPGDTGKGEWISYSSQSPGLF